MAHMRPSRYSCLMSDLRSISRYCSGVRSTFGSVVMVFLRSYYDRLTGRAVSARRLGG